MTELFVSPPAGIKFNRAKAQLKRSDAIRALENLVAGLGEFNPKHLSSKTRYELENLLIECVAELNRQPIVKNFFEKLTRSKKAAIVYAPGQEAQLKQVLSILHKALGESEINKQRKEEEDRQQRKVMLQQKGLTYLEGGDLPLGKATLRVLAEEYGEEQGILTQVAEWLLEYKIFFEAADFLEQAIERFPKDAKAYGLAAKCYREIHEREKAEAVYLKAIQRFGKHPRTLLNLATLYVEWNKKEEAFRTAQDAYSKDKSLTEAKEIMDKFA